MSRPEDSRPRGGGIDAVLITEELVRRPSRPPDHAAEAAALGDLAGIMAADPGAILQGLADRVLELCRAESAGISILEPGEGPETFRWAAVSGAWARYAGRRVARDSTPCGAVLDRDALALLALPGRAFPDAAAIDPPPVQSLLVPLRVAGRPVGTAWAVIHASDPGRTFEAEDARLLERLSQFVAAAYQMEERVRWSTAEWRESEGRLRRMLNIEVVGVLMFDEMGTLVDANDAFLRMTGYAREQVAARALDWRALTPPEHQEHSERQMQALARMGRIEPYEKEYFRRDGSRVWLQFAGASLGDGMIVKYCTDISERKRAEAASRESEERLRLIVASATDYAIFTLDVDRRITSWNPGAEAVFGYAEAEIVGRPVDIIFTEEDRAAGAPEQEVRAALREGRAADERWHIRRDGSRFFASGVLSPLGEGAPRGFVKVLRDLTDRKRMEDALRESRDELEARVAERTAELARANAALLEGMAARTELLRRLVTAQEDERRRVSRELHDGLGQDLTALILGLKALERAVPEGSPGCERLFEVEAIVGRIGREAHDLAVELRPTVLDDIGLDAALATYVTRWSDRTGIAADFQAPGLGAERLATEVETTVYRIVQEALNNVARHADARRVSVIVERGRDDLVALVEDDGRGFDPGRSGLGSGRRGLGLLGMRERVGLVGGALLVESGDGEGTTVRARIPLGREKSGPPGG